MPSRIVFRTGGAELLPLLRPLWERLRDYTRDLDGKFSPLFARATFTGRSAELLKKSGRGRRLSVTLALAGKVPAGYCVATVDASGTAEIDSLFVEKAYRNGGTGEKLLKRGLRWIRAQKHDRVIISVAIGNERVLDFYRRAGFEPYTYVLRPLPKGRP